MTFDFKYAILNTVTTQELNGSIKYKDSEYKYTLDISEKELLDSYVNDWVLNWCKKYHPEAFIEAEKFIKNNLKNETIKS